MTSRKRGAAPDPCVLACALQDPTLLSQTILLSLLQQLSSDLAHLPADLLNWIRDAGLALNPKVRAPDE